MKSRDTLFGSLIINVNDCFVLLFDGNRCDLLVWIPLLLLLLFVFVNKFLTSALCFFFYLMFYFSMHLDFQSIHTVIYLGILGLLLLAVAYVVVCNVIVVDVLILFVWEYGLFN